MNLRLLAAALCAAALVTSAFAQTPDLAAIARSSGTPEIPGLKIVWLAPWGDVARSHPWRNIIEHMHQNATVAQWYKDHGRHEVFARGKEVHLDSTNHSLVLNEVDLTRPNKPEMEGPKTAAEEMQMMRKLYNQMVMEKNQIKGDNLVQIGGIKKAEKELAVAE